MSQISLIPKIKNIVDKINIFIEKNTIDNISKYQFGNDIDNILSSINRIKKEYESPMFFIAASGGIKSGKSTLINLLSHRKVSTTRQGQETTLRSSIITASKQNQIMLFYTTIDNVQDKSELFNKATDYIKGIRTLEEISESKLRVVTEPFTDTNIEKYLTQPILEPEPLLISIQIDEKKLAGSNCNLLKENVAFIDTPGLDGIIYEGMNKDKLIERVDLMFFLQSSVTPINSKSKTYIEDLNVQYKNPPMILLHNKFAIKTWREKYKIDEEKDPDKKAIANAKKIFKDAIKKDIIAYPVDLAKAEDGIYHDNEKLLSESEFKVFEDALITDIKMNREAIHEENVNRSFQRLINNNIVSNDEKENSSIFSIEEQIEEIEKTWESQEKKYIDILEEIESFFTENTRVLTHIDEVKSEDQNVDDGWQLKNTQKELQDTDYGSYIKLSKEMSMDLIAKAVEEVNEKINQDIKTKLNNSKFDNYIQNSKTNMGSYIKDLINEFNRFNTSLSLKQFELKFKIEDAIELFSMESDKVYAVNLWKKAKVYFKGINEEDINTIRQNFNRDIKDEFERIISTFRNQLTNEITTQFQDYVHTLDEKKTELKAVLQQMRKEEIEKINNTKNKLQNLKDFFESMKLELSR